MGETIVAISTPIGMGGIGIVRLSGPESIRIADTLFVGKKRISQLPTYRLTYGKIVEDGKELDEVLISVMKAPHSYTTEDVVEINCHGGLAATTRVLEAVLRRGARLAEPGEFTKRAFLGGRIDLLQAEAVADLVSAKTGLGLETALFQMRGSLSQRINSIKERLTRCLSLIEVGLDFSDEDIDFLETEELLEILSGILEELQELVKSFERGKILREGVKIAIVGRPNVGKSSLLNLLLGEEKAIVTPIPGTTRDSIEEWLQIDGIPFHVIDTAGIRETDDLIELEGRKRTEFHISDAELLVVMLDASEELQPEDRLLATMIKGKKALVVLNKCDLKKVLDKNAVSMIYGGSPIVEMSALKGWGLEEFNEDLVSLVMEDGQKLADRPVITRERHKECLQRAEKALKEAYNAVTSGLSFEYPAFDIREALGSIGEVVGEVTSEDILDEIFSSFCIGK
ncbi:MAG TPA: tRNA uridine-5-carboxymethylaminomethyl(34) synthesis GTPase MnmE [Candidatus Latescibacteria bacterium]|nr:tRNA uridine-5-carboxymethylaminomethyl(34) synthesis GTPase MnmE [Candidatus Latescibacterota bacterium]